MVPFEAPLARHANTANTKVHWLKSLKLAEENLLGRIRAHFTKSYLPIHWQILSCPCEDAHETSEESLTICSPTANAIALTLTIRNDVPQSLANFMSSINNYRNAFGQRLREDVGGAKEMKT